MTPQEEEEIWGFIYGVERQSNSLALCNSILLPGEQRAIRTAAHMAHGGAEHEWVERVRARTDYDGLPYRAEVDGPW